MVTSFFTPARLLGVDDLAASAFPASRAERKHVAAGARATSLAQQATVRLVEALLTVDDESAGYCDILRRLDAAQHHIDRLPLDTSETIYLEQILDSVPLCGEPATALRLCLADYEAFLQREARLEEALDVLVLGARIHGQTLPAKEFAERALRAGYLNRLLARWDRATACYTAAAAAGRILEDDTVLLWSRLGRGAVYRARGELTAARAMAESVMREAARLGLTEVQTAAYRNLGVVLQWEGLFGEGLQAVYYAFQLSPERDERLRALSDIGVGLAAIGAYDESRNALETVLESQPDTLIQASALIRLMGVESAVGNRLTFERRRGEADDLRTRMPPGLTVDYYYKLAVGLVRFGHRRQAEAAFEQALAIAQRHELNGWCDQIGHWLDPSQVA